MLMERFAIVIFAAIALAGCNAEFDDVSETPEYRKVIGELCPVQTSLNAHGVTLPVQRNTQTDVIVLTSLNLSGPEITLSTRLPKGTTLEIVGVRKCKN